jgi:hypothetical protein
MQKLEVVIEADEGDRIAVHSYHLSADDLELLIAIRLDNCLMEGGGTCDWNVLSAEQARRFGRALFAAADGIEFPDEILETAN